MTVVATRGNLQLVDDGDGQGHIEGSDVRRPLDSFLKWGYWEPVDEAVTAAAPLPGEEPLATEYRRFLERYIGKVVRRYRDALTAAGEPNLEQVLDEAGLTEDQRKALKAARDKIAQQAATAQAVQFGISFAVSSPYLQQLVNQHAGKQAERIFEGSRGIVARVIQQSFVEGWSVPQTAAEIKAKLTDAAKWQATMLARTDLIGLANAGSFAAAMSLGEQRPVYKRWINADDEKVRPTHVEAQNQIRPVQVPFVVGGAELMFPGDPSGPDKEVINCRCTQVYLDDPAEIRDHLWFTASGTWDESEHPRDPGGEHGGEFVAKGATATAEPITGDEAIDAWAKAYPAPIVSDDQAEAVSAYQGAWFAAINHKLRDPADFAQRMKDIEAGSRINSWDMIFNARDATSRPVKLDQVPTEVDALTHQLDRVLAETPQDMTVYRYNYGPSVVGREGMGAIEDVYGSYDQLENIVGKTISDAGFQSTTIDPVWANKRLAGDADGILHRIHVPKGTRASYLPQLGASPNFDEEKEVLLARGLTMKATNVVKDGNKYTIDWKIVP